MPSDPSFVPSEDFLPAAGLAGPHRQTLSGTVLRPRHAPALRRERLRTPDADFLDVDWLDAPPEAPHVLVLHGLEGSSRKGYVLATLHEARARGWGAVAMNFRSCSGEPNLLLRSYSSGETGDPLWVCAQIRKAGVRGPLLGVGFSLGGNVLLKLLAETGENAPLMAAVAVSAPFDLHACARTLDGARGLQSIYRRAFLGSLRRKAAAKLRRHPASGIAAAAVRAARSLEAFDEAFTAPSHGFAGARDYYARCSSGPLLARIRRPTLLINAIDDPIVPAASLPDVPAGGPLRLLRPARGGHVGFVGGSLHRPRFWAERQAAAFLAQVLVIG